MTSGFAGETLGVCEVGPRDGLQNERALVATQDKIALLEGLVAAGVRSVEATSFVSPTAVPQMADAAEVMAGARRFSKLLSTALIINEKGYERARAAGCESVALVVVVSEKLAQNNSRMSVQEGLSGATRILARARKEGVRCRVYLAPAWVCPFEGAIEPDHVVRCADTVWEAGPSELAVADTIGHAQPAEVAALFERLGKRYGTEKLAAHFHDTQALGLANAYAALTAGIRTIDASVGGLGGCPFAPGAAGNLATEDLVFLANKLGMKTGIDLDALFGVVQKLDGMVGRRVGGRIRSYWEASRERGTGPRVVS